MNYAEESQPHAKQNLPESLAEVENNFLKRLQRYIINDGGHVEG